jgi:hypothetical protein
VHTQNHGNIGRCDTVGHHEQRLRPEGHPMLGLNTLNGCFGFGSVRRGQRQRNRPPTTVRASHQG